jgi:adenosine deaminase CECR1
MVGSNKMSLMGWRTLVEWSFQYSMISQEEKVERINTFREEWEVFCAEIIENYGKTVVC